MSTDDKRSPGRVNKPLVYGEIIISEPIYVQQLADAREEGRSAGYAEAIAMATTVMNVRSQALMRLGGVHVREAVGIGETAILVRALAPAATTTEPK